MVSLSGLEMTLARLVAAFLRHGDYCQPARVPSAHLPHPLTAKGEAQAQKAATPLTAFASDNNLEIYPVIDSSHLLRGWQTASLLGERLEAEGAGRFRVEEFDDLAERSLGSAGNLTVDQIEKILDVDPRFVVPPSGWKSDSDYQLPLQGAESLMQAGQRVARHVTCRMQALAETAGMGVLKVFVGHGAAFRHAAHHMGILTRNDIARLSMFHAQPVFVEWDGDGIWRHVDGEWKVRNASDVALD